MIENPIFFVDNKRKISRRNFLIGIGALIGGALACSNTSQLGDSASGGQSPQENARSEPEPTSQPETLPATCSFGSMETTRREMDTNGDGKFDTIGKVTTCIGPAPESKEFVPVCNLPGYHFEIIKTLEPLEGSYKVFSSTPVCKKSS